MFCLYTKYWTWVLSKEWVLLYFNIPPQTQGVVWWKLEFGLTWSMIHEKKTPEKDHCRIRINPWSAWCTWKGSMKTSGAWRLSACKTKGKQSSKHDVNRVATRKAHEGLRRCTRAGEDALKWPWISLDIL